MCGDGSIDKLFFGVLTTLLDREQVHIYGVHAISPLIPLITRVNRLINKSINKYVIN